MERFNEDRSESEPVIVLPSREQVSGSLEGLNLDPSPRNQLVPLLEALAGQRLPVSALVRGLLDAIVNYASRTTLSHQSFRRAEIIRREFGKASTYLEIFVTDEEILNQASAALEAALAQPDVAGLIEAEAREDKNNTIDQLLRGSPKGVKQAVRSLAKIPEARRTEQQSAKLEKLLRQLGEQSLSTTATRGRKIRQPGPRDLAKLQAEDRQRREG